MPGGVVGGKGEAVPLQTCPAGAYTPHSVSAERSLATWLARVGGLVTFARKQLQIEVIQCTQRTQEDRPTDSLHTLSMSHKQPHQETPRTQKDCRHQLCHRAHCSSDRPVRPSLRDTSVLVHRLHFNVVAGALRELDARVVHALKGERTSVIGVEQTWENK